jgi:hypothetical protein
MSEEQKKNNAKPEPAEAVRNTVKSDRIEIRAPKYYPLFPVVHAIDMLDRAMNYIDTNTDKFDIDEAGRRATEVKKFISRISDEIITLAVTTAEYANNTKAGEGKGFVPVFPKFIRMAKSRLSDAAKEKLTGETPEAETEPGETKAGSRKKA